MVAPALLAAVRCATIVTRLLAAAVELHGKIAAPSCGRTVFGRRRRRRRRRENGMEEDLFRQA
jgi:hypothetical protein